MLPHRTGTSPESSGDLDLFLPQRMAMRSMELFISQMDSAPEALKISIIQVVFDMLMVHENDFLQEGSENVSARVFAFNERLP